MILRGRILWGTLVWFLCSWVIDVRAEEPQKQSAATVVGGQGEKLVVSQIIIAGNDITKARVIQKELPVSEGDTILRSSLYEILEISRQNLLKTSLFNYVYLDYHLSSDGGMQLSIRVEERWYWWVFPIIEPADRNMSSFFGNGNWDMMNYGAFVQRDNFRGRQEMLKFRLRVGYANQLAVMFRSPEFKHKTGWGMAVNYNVFDHVPVFTLNDQPVYYKDPGNAIYRYVNSSAYLQYRQTLNVRHVLELNFYGHHVADTIVRMNPEFFQNEHTSLEYFTLSLTSSSDKRDSKPYPLTGSFRSLGLMKSGLGAFADEPDFWTLKGRMNYYVPLTKRFYTSVESFAEANTQAQLPYVVKGGLGYRDYMNGYEYYVLEGSATALMKTRVLYELVPTRISYLNFIPTPKFSKIHYTIYLKAFFDNGCVWNDEASPLNKMVNTYLYSYGVGLDFVTFYDKVFSFNFAVNKFNEKGLFFQLAIPLE